MNLVVADMASYKILYNANLKIYISAIQDFQILIIIKKLINRQSLAFSCHSWQPSLFRFHLTFCYS